MQIIEFVRFHTPSLPLLAILLACGSDPQGEGGGEGSTTASEESSSSSSGSTTSAAESSTSTTESSTSTTESSTSTTSDDDGPSRPRLDVEPLPDAPIVESGCRAVDFLFVIDNSGSMASYQANLITNFPAFIAGIETTLEDVDSYHVGVVTTDAYAQNVPGCNVLGGLVVRTQNGGMCGPYAEGENYMTEEDDLASAFSCAANVGVNGSATERPMNAMESALNGTLSGNGQCNEGFLREDALLVVIIITDEPDDSTGTPATWYQTVVTAKNDTPENAAVVAFLRYDSLPEESPSPCPINSAAYADIPNFVRMFLENGFLGGICQPNYGPTFEQVIAVIDNACENFIPPAG